MANKRPKPEEIVAKLRQVEVLVGQDQKHSLTVETFTEDWHEVTHGRTMREAVEWYRARAEIGDPTGLYVLGLLYWKGLYLDHNEELGRKYILRAAELGNSEAIAEVKRENWQ